MINNIQGVKVRHSSFPDCTGRAVRKTTKEYLNGEKYPGCVVVWDKSYLLHNIVANYNLVFIVPAKGMRHV